MTFDQLEGVDREVNAMSYRTDLEIYGRSDVWERADPEVGGDCDDYAIVKLRRLLDLGWPIAALRLATCYVETGEYHAVLLADLDGQTWVLDNRQPGPTRFQDLIAAGYRFDRIQIAGEFAWRSYV